MEGGACKPPSSCGPAWLLEPFGDAHRGRRRQAFTRTLYDTSIVPCLLDLVQTVWGRRVIGYLSRGTSRGWTRNPSNGPRRPCRSRISAMDRGCVGAWLTCQSLLSTDQAWPVSRQAHAHAPGGRIGRRLGRQRLGWSKYRHGAGVGSLAPPPPPVSAPPH